MCDFFCLFTVIQLLDKCLTKQKESCKTDPQVSMRNKLLFIQNNFKH